MTDYEKKTDEELIMDFRGGDTAIMDYLLEKYKPMVKKKAKAMYLLGGDSDDLIQEGMIGCLKRCGIMIRPRRLLLVRSPRSA